MKDRITFIAVVLLIMFLMSVVCSCGSCRKEQTILNTHKLKRVEVKSETWDVTRFSQSTEQDNLVETIEFTHTIYDTHSDSSKILSQATYKKTKRNDKRKTESNDSTAMNVSDNSIEIANTDSLHAHKRKEKTETTVPNQLGCLTNSLCILIALLIVWYIIRRFRKN